MKYSFYQFIIGIGIFLVTSCDKKVGLLPQTASNTSVSAVNSCDSTKYSKDVQPILNTKCVSCHGVGYPLGDFTNYAATMVKVNDNTFLYRTVTAHDMPGPSGLPQSDIDKIKCWLDNGAKNN